MTEPTKRHALSGSDVTPKAMLVEYRRQSHPFMIEQAKMLRDMPPNERSELLFYMLMNTNEMVHFLHKAIDPNAPPKQGMEAIKTETH